MPASGDIGHVFRDVRSFRCYRSKSGGKISSFWLGSTLFPGLPICDRSKGHLHAALHDITHRRFFEHFRPDLEKIRGTAVKILPRNFRKRGPTRKRCANQGDGFAYARGSACLCLRSLTHTQRYSPHFNPTRSGRRDAGYALTSILSVLLCCRRTIERLDARSIRSQRVTVLSGRGAKGSMQVFILVETPRPPGRSRRYSYRSVRPCNLLRGLSWSNRGHTLRR